MNDLQNNLNDRDALVSAYVDGELDVADRRKVEELIKNDPTYAQEVEELRLLKAWLYDLPSPAPRRSFTLDPATAPRPRRLLFPTLRWATAIAAVLLMLTVGADLLGGISSGMGGAGSGATSISAGSTTSGAAAGGAADQDLNRSTGGASASSANDSAQDLPQPAAQNAQPSASGSAAAAASASAVAAPSDAVVELSAPSASAGASASAAASAFASFSAAAEEGGSAAASGAYPGSLPDMAATMVTMGPTVQPEQAFSGSASERGGAGASIVAAPSLPDTDPTGPDTTSTILRVEPEPAPTNTLRVAQVVLLITTAGLGAGAWLARRRNM